MYNPKISIIVPVYNVSQYITKCLDSVYGQTYKNIELILVDDCGSDDSMTIVQDYLASHVSIDANIISHQKNRGLSAGRNSGMEKALGEYVYFLDSDDYITPDCIEALVKPLNNKKYDVVVGDYQYSNGEKSDLKLHNEELSDKQILDSYANGLWYVMAWNKLCRKDFLLANNLTFEEGYLHEDVIWSFKLACKAQSMYVINKVTYNYLVRSSSIMTSMSIEHDVNVYLKAFAEIIDFVKAEGRIYGVSEYKIIEGKKCGILYSLLQKKEFDLYNKYYKDFYLQRYVSPLTAYRKHIINFSYLLRDLHYCMPAWLGRLYKRLFFNMLYVWRGKKIEGAVW